jgi:plastocyanin
VTLDNRDAGVAHDIVLYAPDGAEVASTSVFTGPGSETTSFTASSPGRYAFKCSVHPREMTGAITVS